ncbi:4-oxalocrotonate tautomerase family protein [Rhizobium sp. KVB221]|uniref:4-oxalocrotonate tautomerase family protein n=1 Tax=Rhizobium setariae TaxID=2801340 RepID=A0A936YNW6_9HYPH|nr:4-oxalocrotonate tautomerase family protein [Rhizobium setariae]MBL0373948.1 4-oxalocrotonate tautomerase family protein [Rhizobium setariae]
MPIIRVELLTGRSAEKKAELAKEFTETLERVAGVKPEATTVVFVEVAPENWTIAGAPLGAPPTSK